MNCALRFETHSDEETREIGRGLAAFFPAQAIVVLAGNLGTGKTTLTQGIAEGRGAARAEDVSSPTFTLIHEYGDPVSIYHIDLYRLDTAEEARRLGLEEIFDSPALVLLEWGDKFPEIIPPGAFRVELNHIELPGDDEAREIKIWTPGVKRPEADAQRHSGDLRSQVN
jgi:tRNA threonylcarbamoyladenosine biosynthesis protein TsaE